MTLSSSLSAGVSGLSANATKLATISDNIANSSTFGYKRLETDFNSIVNSQGRSSSYSAGGVRSSSLRHVNEGGSLIGTNNPTDIALRGQGMLPVARSAEVAVGNGEATMLLTRTGSFRTDKDGFLITQSGLTLLGWEANPDGTIPAYPRDSSNGLSPVQLPLTLLETSPTTQISLGVNLPAASTEPADPGVTPKVQTQQIEYYDNLGTSERLEFVFTPALPAAGATAATNTWTMEVFDSALGGASLGVFEMTFNDSQDAGGTLSSVTPAAGNAAPADAYNGDTGQIVVEAAGGEIAIELGLLNQKGAMSQLSDPFQPTNITKNGTPVGNLTRVEVDANGYLNAFYDTGQTRVVYQLPVVTVASPNGMIALDAQTYSASPDSGQFFLWDAGDGPAGEMAGFAREQSNVDVAGQLTELITTQRAYSSNAKVIQTVDEMLQETTNIKR